MIIGIVVTFRYRGVSSGSVWSLLFLAIGTTFDSIGLWSHVYGWNYVQFYWEMVPATADYHHRNLESIIPGCLVRGVSPSTGWPGNYGRLVPGVLPSTGWSYLCLISIVGTIRWVVSSAIEAFAQMVPSCCLPSLDAAENMPVFLVQLNGAVVNLLTLMAAPIRRLQFKGGLRAALLRLILSIVKREAVVVMLVCMTAHLTAKCTVYKRGSAGWSYCSCEGFSLARGLTDGPPYG